LIISSASGTSAKCGLATGPETAAVPRDESASMCVRKSHERVFLRFFVTTSLAIAHNAVVFCFPPDAFSKGGAAMVKKMKKVKSEDKPVKYLFEPGILYDEAIHKAAVVLGNKWEEWANIHQDKFDYSKMRALSKEEVAAAEAKKK
jgi:hypothetical protein